MIPVSVRIAIEEAKKLRKETRDYPDETLRAEFNMGINAAIKTIETYFETHVDKCSHPLAYSGEVYNCSALDCPIHGERNTRMKK